MDWYDYVIVGSGPAGTAAARRMPGVGTCIVDAGELPDYEFPSPSLRDALQAGNMEALLGKNWEMLSNLVDPSRLHLKLRAAGLRFVMSGDQFRVRDGTGKVILNGRNSNAAGGMSNVWGAQLLRYTDDDLAEAGDWPISALSLEKYYQDLEAHIGIAGQVDDLNDFLGGALPAMPPVEMVPAASYVYRRYLQHQKRIRSPHLLLGRPRLALATRPANGRPAYSFGETEFFSSKQPGLYTARVTLEELKAKAHITCLGRHRLLKWRECSEYVELELCALDDGHKRTVRTKHLLLGCGTMQTAKLVLQHHGQIGRALPFIDHPPTLLPFFVPATMGCELPVRSYPIQLIGTLPRSGRLDMITFYYPGGMLWSDLVPDVPLPMSTTVRMIGSLLGGMLVAQIWQTSRPTPANRLRIGEGGMLIVDYLDRPACTAVPDLLPALRNLGAYSLARLASMSHPGWGFHYAGSLPMRYHPQEFETHVDGRLWNSRRVRVIDGSALPSLPAKNHSLTLMANAARIADEVLRCGY